MQKHEVINAIVEHGYCVEKMDEYGTVYFGKTILRGDDVEVHKVVEISEHCKGLYLLFYKTRKMSEKGKHETFGETVGTNLDEIGIENGVVSDSWFNEFVL